MESSGKESAAALAIPIDGRRVPQDSLAAVARHALASSVNNFSLYAKRFIDLLSHPLNATPQLQWKMIEEEPCQTTA